MPANPATGNRLYSPPYPNLQLYPSAGVMSADGIPFVEVGNPSLNAGESGVTMGMTIVVYWQDLDKALTTLLGYTFRPNAGRISRLLPWQHPRYNQLWVHSIADVRGERIEGTTTVNESSSPGIGYPVNYGPTAAYNLAFITIRFWRPPYAVRTDIDVWNAGNNTYQEWLRYTDRHWQINSQFITREGSHMQWSNSDGAGGTKVWKPGFPITIAAPTGVAVSHMKVSRRWYQIPEAAIFQTNAQDSTPTGRPYNFLYTQTSSTNPISLLVRAAGSPIPGTVNAPIGGDPWNGLAHTVGNLDANTSNRMFGQEMGTMMFESAEIVTRELQLPAKLMQIPQIANNEALSQVQYDVVFHFDIFDPPPGFATDGTAVPFRGHNLAPFSGDSLWYPTQTQSTVGNTGFKSTPYQYADHSDLFKPL